MIAFPHRPKVGRLRVRLVLGLLALGLAIAPAAGAPTGGDPERGERLYRRYCAVCHGSGGRGDGPNAAFLEDDQPRDLTDSRYFARLSDEHLYRVIADGGAAIRGSRFMPPWGRTLSPAQLRDLVAFVRTLSMKSPLDGPPLTGALSGSALAQELGCPVCHRIGDLEPVAVGPDLTAEGSRVQRAWLVRFLKAPHPIRPAGHQPLWRSRMPDFRLSEEEVASLAEYLMSRRHEAPEPGPGSPPPASLTQRGREVFRQYACRACHTSAGTGGRAAPDLDGVARRLRPGWVARFIEDPQAIDSLTPMPNLGVDAAAARAITTFLFAGAPPRAEPPPDAGAVSKGAVLFADLGCAGCHRDEGAEGRKDIGPDLSGAGDRLKPEWLSEFLVRPTTIRPWLAGRMPGFRLTEAETRALVQFISDLKDDAAPPLPERLRFRGLIPAASIEVGRRLASREFLSCASCHVGGEPPEGSPEEWAPDLRLSADRLNPDWIVRWLRDPQRLAPGTKMPTYFSDESSGPEEILEGDEERQILALRDYILSLGAPGGAPEGAPTAPPRH